MTIPKYLILKKQIQEWTLNGHLRPGQQIPTEVQLAKQFQISRQTVRMAVNELVHEKLLKRYQGRGTFVTDTTWEIDEQRSSHKLIAVVTTSISDYIFPSIIRGIEARLSKENYSMLLFSTNNNFDREAQALDSVLSRPIDGVIVEPTKSTYSNPNLRSYLHLLNRNMPFVMLHGGYMELNIPCVRMDDEYGGMIAVEHLHHLGHERIGMLCKDDDIQGRLRLRGFIKAHLKQDIKVSSGWVKLYSTDDFAAGCNEYVQSFKTEDMIRRPTAIVCYNDEIASELMRRLSALGISMPNDVSLVSFDDSQWAQDNEVTSIQHPKYDMGVTVAEKVLHTIHAQSENTHSENQLGHIFTPKLIARASSKCREGRKLVLK